MAPWLFTDGPLSGRGALRTKKIRIATSLIIGYLRRFSEENLVGIEKIDTSMHICGLRSICLENIRKKNFNLLFSVEK